VIFFFIVRGSKQLNEEYGENTFLENLGLYPWDISVLIHDYHPDSLRSTSDDSSTTSSTSTVFSLIGIPFVSVFILLRRQNKRKSNKME